MVVMKKNLLSFFLLCLLSLNTTAQMTPATPVPGAGILFRELTVSEALKVAKDENKLIFVDCFTTWCGPCKMLSNVVFKDSTFADYFNRHFINLKIDMEKGEGPELHKKYDVRGYPTLLFLDSNGEVVHRLIGADKAPVLLKNVKLGVEGGGLSNFRKRYEGGERDSAFVFAYIDVLSGANREEELSQVVAAFLEGKEQKMLKYEPYFSVFYDRVNDVNSAAFQFVVDHQKEFSDKYPGYALSLGTRLLGDWITGSYPFLKTDGTAGQCTLDEKGLNAYVARMKQANVAEAVWIGEVVRLSRDGIMNQWESFVKRGDKLIASKTSLADNEHLLQWVNWMNHSCTDKKLREKAARWCDNAYKEQVRKDEESKKNLPPGTIQAYSMVDYKVKFQELASALRKPIEQK